MRDESGRTTSAARGRGGKPPGGAAGLAVLLLAGLAGAVAALGAPRAAAAQDQELDVPYVPTPRPVVEKMLELTRPVPEDSLYDLGSGDGRIVITAAEVFGTPGVGVELDSGRVAEARRSARESGVDDLVRFVRGDLFEVDVSPASVVTLYLLSSVNLELRPKLFRELRPGTRVVSHDFDMGEWAADTVVEMPDHTSTVHYWVMPAQVHGRWEVQLPGGGSTTLELDQKFQEVRAVPGSRGARVVDARVRGDSVRLTLRGVEGASGGTLELRGTARDGSMTGFTSDGVRWSARRSAGADWPIDEWRAPAARP